MKKQRTRWVYRWIATNSYIRIGIVRNINTKKYIKADVIRYQIKSYGKRKLFNYYLTPDEAICLSAGLNHAVGFFLREFYDYDKWRKS